jgi:hypothetical protein
VRQAKGTPCKRSLKPHMVRDEYLLVCARKMTADPAVEDGGGGGLRVVG